MNHRSAFRDGEAGREVGLQHVGFPGLLVRRPARVRGWGKFQDRDQETSQESLIPVLSYARVCLCVSVRNVQAYSLPYGGVGASGLSAGWALRCKGRLGRAQPVSQGLADGIVAARFLERFCTL